MNKIIAAYVTNSSKNKLYLIPDSTHNLNAKLEKLFRKMKTAFTSNINLIHNEDCSVDKIKDIFNEFVSNMCDVSDSKLEADLSQMNDAICVKLIVRSDTVRINFIFNKHSTRHYVKQIAAIIHAINTFLHLYVFDYNNLKINICLDQNSRNIPLIIQNDPIAKKIIYLQKNSLAFGVSGVTYKARRLINLTKTEEIIKLLFHELIHYVELDAVLLNTKFQNRWAIDSSDLNLSEAYTEFVSVILHSMYVTLHLNPTTELFAKILSTEINYSVCLTARILKFFQYNCDTYENFFTGLGKRNEQPIALWEYIFLRTILFLDLDTVLEIVPDDLKLESDSKNQLLHVFADDQTLVTRVKEFMLIDADAVSVSYLAVDVDWSLI